MKEQLTFDDYENLFNGVLLKTSRGYVFVPDHKIGEKGFLERADLSAVRAVANEPVSSFKLKK